jgi:hypothetical protein
MAAKMARFRDAAMPVLQRPENRRRFARVRPSGLVSPTATIIIDAKTPSIACTLVDLSAGGACLQVPNPEQLPKRFVLLHGKTKKSCLVMWRARYRIGVQF